MKKKSTLWYRIGKSNWYTRTDARGLEVKRQGALSVFTRNNNIIRGVRKYYIERKPRKKGFDERIFDMPRPKAKKTVTIYDKKGNIISRRDVLPEDFFSYIKFQFNLNYPGIVRGEVTFTVD